MTPGPNFLSDIKARGNANNPNERPPSPNSVTDALAEGLSPPKKPDASNAALLAQIAKRSNPSQRTETSAIANVSTKINFDNPAEVKQALDAKEKAERDKVERDYPEEGDEKKEILAKLNNLWNIIKLTPPENDNRSENEKRLMKLDLICL